MTKCYGCGAFLQNDDISKEGYTKNLDNSLCERCFRIKNYNDYKPINKDNNIYLDIIKNINPNDLVLVVVDIFSISNSLKNIINMIKNDKLLILTKRDLLKDDIYNEKLLNYFDNSFVDKIIISSKKNYNFDLLMSMINKYKHGKNVYVVGFTNAGKSTLINKIIYNYTDISKTITTSNLPSTTLDTIKIEINDDLCLIDTPGIVDSGNIINYIDKAYLKKVIPNKVINPIVYQIKAKQSILIDDLCRVDVEPYNNLVFYFSNSLNIERVFKDTDKLCNLEKHEINVLKKCDIVISGLGFIKVMNKCSIILYTLNGVSVYTRDSLL